MSKLHDTLRGLGWAAVAITIWSGSLVMLRLGVTTSLNAYDLTMLRFGVAAVLLAPVAMRRGTGTDQLEKIGIGAMTIAFGAPYVTLISLAMRTAPSAVAGALNPGVMAIASVLLARVVFGNRIGLARFVGLVMTASGVTMFALAGGTITTGHYILVMTGIMWAIYTLIVRRAAVPALNATALVAVFSALVFLPIYFLFLPKQILVAPLFDILLQAVFQGVLVSVAAIYAFNRSGELLGAVAGASLSALIPVVTLGLGFLFLLEKVSAREIIAAGVVTLGLAMILVGQTVSRWILHHIRRCNCRKG